MKEAKEAKEEGKGVDMEFKELDREKGALPSSVPKEIVAFANTEGGELYIGMCASGLLEQKKSGYRTVYVPKT